jgi:translation initiation factor IF-2
MDRMEEEIGQVDHYYGHAHIAGIWLKKGKLKLGDRIHILGHTTDLETTVSSMQIEHQDVREALPGAHVGIPVTDKVREHDRVFIIQQ